MINLLPYKNKITVKKEYLRRLFVVAGIFVSFVLFSAIILVMPLLYFLSSLESNYEKQISFYKERIHGGEMLEAASSVSDLNAKMKILDEQKKDFSELSPSIEKIIDAAPKGIKLNGFLYDKIPVKKDKNKDKKKETKYRWTIKGRSESRDGLLSFIGILKNEADFSGVQSPVSNLLKVSDIKFTIVLNLR